MISISFEDETDRGFESEGENEEEEEDIQPYIIKMRKPKPNI